MQNPVKTSKRSSEKRKNKDPYGAGEQPGKKAKSDARRKPVAEAAVGPSNQPTQVDGSQGYFTTIDFASHPTGQGVIQPLPTFNPQIFDIQNAEGLGRLKRPQLDQLCKHHGLSAGGTNADKVQRLLQLVV
jgi:hypothetical protein